jgi:hypothetical protein
MGDFLIMRESSMGTGETENRGRVLSPQHILSAFNANAD